MERNISVLEPIGAAVEKTSQILFRPFLLSRWLAIGFAVWLAYLGTGGGGGGGNYNFGDRGGCGDFNPQFNEFKHEVAAHLPIILSVGGVVLVFVLAIIVLLLWLRSRGQFVLLNSVAQNSTAIAEPWSRYALQANSLFLFKLVLMLLNIAAIAVLVVPLGLVIWALAETDFKVIAAGQIAIASFLGLAIFFMSLLFAAVRCLTTDLVVPVMYVQRLSVLEAWKRILKVISEHKGTVILYLLIVFLISIVLGMATAAIGLTACCCFCCVSWVFLIPFVGGYLFKVLTLPLWVWRRAYSALFMAQFGPEYDVFIRPDASPRVAVACVPSPPADQPPQPIGPDFV